jgi:hypothetical protein
MGELINIIWFKAINFDIYPSADLESLGYHQNSFSNRILRMRYNY